MNEYQKILELTEDNKVKLGESFRKLIGKDFKLGMTRYMCRWGTLSDGHEHMNVFRYPQALKEAFNISQNISLMKAQAMDAQADYMEAEEAFNKAEKQSDKLRAESKMMLAKSKMISALTTLEDQMPMLDEFLKVAEELRPEWEARFPEGIEQAEQAKWTMIAEYRIKKRKLGYQENLTHVPLDPAMKAKLAIEHKMPDLGLFLEAEDPDGVKAIGGVEPYLKLMEQNATARINHTN